MHDCRCGGGLHRRGGAAGAFADSTWLVIGGWILGGAGVGVASVVAAAYIAETSPPHVRLRRPGG
ncbi:MAG: MFS transporter [Mycobacterium sp.]|uniref:MFS transporter n=1 Tax=Mycobacterium sp. TaxID=1785 RepID=UPI00262F2334|nr:MFS transporter [Mycobacterium sp.]MDI3313885.1 MFS transporter [Mycobacterium sp.]